MKNFAIIFITAVFLFSLPSILSLAINKNDNETVNEIIYTEGGNSIDVQAYVTGAVAKKLVFSVPYEALKAIATAVYTEYIYMKETAPDGNVYTNKDAYMSVSEATERWGSAYYHKIKEAVKDVYGIYLTYEGKAIRPVFHEVNNGKTESSCELTGVDIPWLTSVYSPEDTMCTYINSKTVYTKKQMELLIRTCIENADLSLDCTRWITEIKCTENGGVISAVIGETKVSGDELRQCLLLSSCNFELTEKDGEFSFYVRGVGNGLGMSLYGAAAMAENGYGYADILNRYFQNTELSKIIP